MTQKLSYLFKIEYFIKKSNKKPIEYFRIFFIEYKDEILQTRRDKKITTIHVETGYEKTTQLSQYLKEVSYINNNMKIGLLNQEE